MAVIYRVQAVGQPMGTSTVREGAALALKLSADDSLALETMSKEITTFEELQTSREAPPCPRMFDIIEVKGQRAGMVMEWCPTDMERWWDGILVLPDALEPLCRALSDVCQRIAEYHTFFAARGIRSVHADIKPRNVVLADDGRWLVIDFGAAKQRPIEDANWDATRLILGTENFIAPEMLFNARKQHPEAMDTWSVALTFYTLLRMRKYRLDGHELPSDGSHNIQFRSHRMTTVVDLRERKPTLFADRELDPTAFPSPGRLPTEDRRGVAEALKGVFGRPDLSREKKLEGVVLEVLYKALSIDPAARFTRAEDLAAAFDRIVRTYWELEGSLQDPAPVIPEPALIDDGRPTVVAEIPFPKGPDTPAPAPAARPLPAPSPVASTPTPLPPFPTPAPVPQAERPEPIREAPDRSPTVAMVAPVRPPAAAPAPPVERAPDPSLVAPAAPKPQPVPAPTTPAPVTPPPVAEAPAQPKTPRRPDEPTPRMDAALPSRTGAEMEPVMSQLTELRKEVRTLQKKGRPAGGVPLWLILALCLLLFCQAIQFGLLLAIFLRTLGVGTSTPATSPVSTVEAPAAVQPPAAPAVAETPVVEEAPAAPAEDAIAEAEPPSVEPPAPKVEPPAPKVEPPAPKAPSVSSAEKVSNTSSADKAVSTPPKTTSSTPSITSSKTSSSKTTSGSTSKTSTKSSTTPAAASTPEAATSSDGDEASIRVEGANAYLMGPTGRVSPGPVYPGVYEVFAETSKGAGFSSVAKVTVKEGQKILFKCGFGTCRLVY